ncbi:unnamed protein product, partial [Candidula unifasciata]
TSLSHGVLSQPTLKSHSDIPLSRSTLPAHSHIPLRHSSLMNYSPSPLKGNATVWGMTRQKKAVTTVL